MLLMERLYLVSFTVPPPQIHTYEDGCVEIRVGDQRGVVSSMHLVDTKIAQLEVAYRRKHGAGFTE